MDKELRILYVEDSIEEQEDLKEVLSAEQINGYKITIDCEASFEMAVERSRDYHIIILDLYRGNATKGGENVGIKVFESVKGDFFVPVIFFSGNITDIVDLKSQVVGVARKSGDLDELKMEIKRLTRHNIPFLKENIHQCLENELKKYFWDIIQERNDIFVPDADDYSLGYLLLRNFADSLSKENIKRIVCDDTIRDDKVHPMEFYIFPINISQEIENGEILRKKDSGDLFVVLTPSCDFVERFKKNGESQGRAVDRVLLVKTIPLKDTVEYHNFNKNRNKENTEILKRLINASKSDRFFFLPKTPFIDNCIVDFQLSHTIRYEELNNTFERIAKLDSPYAQSMVSSFIRYFDRIGFPDIDTDYVFEHL